MVEQLLRVIFELQKENEKLRAEVDRLKGLPELPQRPQQPSTLNDPQGKPSQIGRKRGEDYHETIVFNRGSGEVKHPICGQVMARGPEAQVLPVFSRGWVYILL